MEFGSKLADFLRQGADTLVNLPTEAQRFITNPQAFTELVTGKNPLPKETGFVAGASGLPPKNPAQGGVLNPASAPYQEGYEQGEPVAIAAMALPAYASALRAGAPKAYNALENYMVKSGGMIPLEAYHGTPHKIEGGFDINKVGTGEGAQVYGHGMYFAENPKVADSYRTLDPAGGASLYTRRTFLGNELTPQTPEYHAAHMVDKLGVKKAKAEFQDWLNNPPDYADESLKSNWQKSLDTLNQATKKSDFGTLKHEGNLYKVDIPDEHIPNMLDWDKPFFKQTPEVQEALKKMGLDIKFGSNKESVADFVKLTGNLPPYFQRETGHGIYSELSKQLGGDKQASKYLNSLGIKGTRYLDQQSRGKSGTSNFVVFEPSDVKILEENSKPVARKELLKKQVDKLK